MSRNHTGSVGTAFSPVQKLEVWRTFADGGQVLVGWLAQNRQGVYFQYAADYRARFFSLSPFTLDWSDALQQAPRQPHHGLHGVFAEAWLVKFTSAQLALGHEEGLCEAVYLGLAEQAGIDVPDWRLLSAPPSSGATHWLALKRFDRRNNEDAPPGRAFPGRFHMHSACGLLDADFRAPSLDYEDLIKAGSILCKSPHVGQKLFRRAIFNLFGLNQDDHSKNWAFLQNDQGDWFLAPFYDVTFSPSPFGEHATAFAGHGKQPPLQAIQRLAEAANFASWEQARKAIEEIVAAVSDSATGAGTGCPPANDYADRTAADRSL